MSKETRKERKAREFDEFCREEDARRAREQEVREKAFYNKDWWAFEVRLPEVWLCRNYIQKTIRERGGYIEKVGKTTYRMSFAIYEDATFIRGWIRLMRVPFKKWRKEGKFPTPRAYYIGKPVVKVKGLGVKIAINLICKRLGI